jgi:hypothetical protein
VIKTMLPTQFDNLRKFRHITHVSLWLTTGEHHTNIALGTAITPDPKGLYEITELTLTVSQVGESYAVSGTAMGRKGWTVAVIEVSGTVNFFGTDTATAPFPYLFSQSGRPGVSQYFGSNWGLGLDPDPAENPRPFRYVWTPYPASGAIPPSPLAMNLSVAEGKTNLMSFVEHIRGKFVMAGTSQGAQVVDEVYKELRSGSLTAKKPNLLGVTAFGNPRRAEGHTFPNCPDPGGHGIEVLNLQDKPEDLWWDFARPIDYITSMHSSGGAQFVMTLWAQANAQTLGTTYDTAYPGLDFSHAPFALPNVFEILALLGNTLIGHSYFDYFSPGVGWQPLLNSTGDTRGCVTIARDYIWSLVDKPGLQANCTAQWQFKVGEDWQEVG